MEKNFHKFHNKSEVQLLSVRDKDDDVHDDYGL